jgi:hypothetical protein
MSTDDIVNALGAAAGDMAKQLGVEVLAKIAADRERREKLLAREVQRLKSLIAKVSLLLASGGSEKAMECLFREVTSWEDGDWTDEEEVHDLRLKIVDALEELADAEDDDESGEED